MRRSVNVLGVVAVFLASVALQCNPQNQGAPTPTNGVVSITLTPPNATLEAGTSVQLALSVVIQGNVAQTVTYTSSAPSVASVNSSGLVTALSAGTATIIATSTVDATKAAASLIVVTAPPAPPPSVLTGSYNISASKTVDTGCNFASAFNGQVQVSGNSDGSNLTLRMVERLTRVYLGTAQANGSYSAAGSGNLDGFAYTGTVTGQGTATTIQGTETLNFSSGCPGRQVVYTFTGTR